MKINRVFKISSEIDIQNAKLTGPYWNNLKYTLLQLYGKDLFICVNKKRITDTITDYFSIVIYTKKQHLIKTKLFSPINYLIYPANLNPNLDLHAGYAIVHFWFKRNKATYDRISDDDFPVLTSNQVKEDNKLNTQSEIKDDLIRQLETKLKETSEFLVNSELEGAKYLAKICQQEAQLAGVIHATAEQGITVADYINQLENRVHRLFKLIKVQNEIILLFHEADKS